MIESVELKWASGAQDKLTKDIPDQIVREVATATLNLVIPTVPERTGKMKRSTMAGGVRGSNSEYYIGSYTDYAKYVYVMNNDTTHWTTSGTNSYWFKEYWLKHGQSILNMVVEENKL